MRAAFRPTFRQAFVLAVLTAAALGFALYFRYGVIQNATIGVGCDYGPPAWFCPIRSGVIRLYGYGVFGWAALAIAVIQLMRPSVAVLGAGLVAAAFGIVLYSENVLLAGIATGIMILSLARPAPRPA
jgi:hypothetical protein